VVLCRSRNEAEAALTAVRDWTERNGLRLHPDKTRIVEYEAGESFEFLGFEFRKDRVFARKKSLLNIRSKIRDKTPRLAGNSLKAVIAGVNPILRGWFRYFRDSPEHVFRDMDGFVRRRLRSMLDRRRGIRSTHPGRESSTRWPTRFFADRALYSMQDAWKERSTRSAVNH